MSAGEAPRGEAWALGGAGLEDAAALGLVIGLVMGLAGGGGLPASLLDGARSLGVSKPQIFWRAAFGKTWEGCCIRATAPVISGNVGQCEPLLSLSLSLRVGIAGCLSWCGRLLWRGRSGCQLLRRGNKTLMRWPNP